MKKIISLRLFLLVAIYFVAQGQDRVNLRKKHVTFLVYIAADNDLAEFVELDLKEMMQVGSNNQINILAFVTHKLNDGPKVTQRLFIEKGQAVPLGSTTPMDSGDPATVITACDWALSQYPAEHFVLIFWNHGSGAFNRTFGHESGGIWNRGVCYDDTTGHHLTDVGLQKVLSFASNQLGKKIDIVAFDACLMADIEVAYAVQPYADFMVASQETIPGEGYDYQRMLSRPASERMSMRNLAMHMVSAYNMAYHLEVTDYTLSAFDLSLLAPLINNINTVAQQLGSLLQSPLRPMIKKAIQQSRATNACTTFSAEGHIDLAHFYTNVYNNLRSSENPALFAQLFVLLEQGVALIDRFVIARVHGKDFPQAHGLSIYFPGRYVDKTYPTLVWSQNTVWLPFIKQYLHKGKGIA